MRSVIIFLRIIRGSIKLKKSLQVFFFLLAASLFVMSGCGKEETNTSPTPTPTPDSSSSDDSEEQTFIIGITQFVAHPSLDQATEGFKKALEDEGFKKIYESYFGEPIRYLIKILMSKPILKTESEIELETEYAQEEGAA